VTTLSGATDIYGGKPNQYINGKKDKREIKNGTKLNYIIKSAIKKEKWTKP